VMDSINEQRLRSTVEPVIEEIFGQKLGLRCELNGAPLVASASAPVTPVGAVAVAGAETKGSKSGAATKRPPTVTESSAGALQSAPDTAPPVRDLAAEAGNNLTVRMAMDAFGARIESVIPPEDSRRAG